MRRDYNLPKNWVKTSIEDVILYQKGKKPKKLEQTEFEDSLPYLDIKAFEKKKIRKYADKESSQIIDELDVVIVWDGARSGWVSKGVYGALGSTIARLRPFVFSQNYLYYFLDSQFSYVNSNTKGTGIPHVDPQILWGIKMPLPPLNEQHHIVSKIEELFSELNNGESNLKLAQRQLRVYQQALLKHAFEGKLTEQWRKENNPEPAEKLLERIKKERQQRYEQELREWRAAIKVWEKDGKKGRKPGKPTKPIEVENLNSETLRGKPELPNSWLYNHLIAVIEVPKYGTSKKCTYDNGGTGVLRIPNLKSGIIDETDLKYAYFTEGEKEPYLLKEDDILTIRSNGSVDLVGRCSIIRKINTDKLYAGYLIRLRPFSNLVDSRYLLNILESQDLRNQIELKAKSTSGVNNINSGELSSLIIPLCSKDEQIKIADELESQFSVIDNLEKTIESGLQKSEALRQSILKKAFEGKLVPQDPTDEPASELLKRIQAEKKKYLEEQKQLKKRKPKNSKKMSKELNIEEVLKTSDKPMLAKEVWQKSKHKDNIEDFYKELKGIQSKIKEVKKGAESLLSLAK